MFNVIAGQPSHVHCGFVDQYHAVYTKTRPSMDFTCVGFGTSGYCCLILIHLNLLSSQLPLPKIIIHNNCLTFLQKICLISSFNCNKIAVTFVNNITYLVVQFLSVPPGTA